MRDLLQQRVSEDQEPFEVVLLDGDLPADEVRELALLLKALDPAPMILLMLTTTRLSGLSGQASIPSDAHLTKPICPRELWEAVASGVRKSVPADRQRTVTIAPVSPGALPSPPAEVLEVLLVEDTPVNQKLAVRLLERRGHRVTVVENGVEALAEFDKHSFDVILMDVQMPVMDGLEAAAEIRRREKDRGGRVPIVAMTAHVMQGDRERCLQVGMDAYVAKPITPSELFGTIESLAALDRRPAQGERSHV